MNAASPSRTVTDTAGRKVVAPVQINRIATIGTVPVFNGFLFAFGEGGKIVNGLPDFARSPRYRLQSLFAPSLAGKPQMQGGSSDPKLEELLKAAPDGYVHHGPADNRSPRTKWHPNRLPGLEAAGGRKRVMRLIGDVLGKPAIAAEYISYFESAVPRVTTITGRILRERWPKALYCNLKRLTQDQLIGEWWIETAGGVSVTNNGRSVEAYPFSIEQMFTWDPDIFIVASPRI